MTIIQLEYLLAVANYRSFSVASEHCFVTQPSLSTQIKNLEEELGVVLLNRNYKPITLTEAGRVVIKQARTALSEFSKVKESITELKGEVKGELRLAVIPTIAPYLLHLFLPKFMSDYPEVNVEVKEMFTRDIITALRHDTIDMAILAGGFTPAEEVDEEFLFRDNFYLYSSKNHPLYNRTEVSISDLDTSKMILLADGHCLRTQILDLCHSRNLYENSFRFESGSLETIMRMVDSTGGITIIPKMCVETADTAYRENIRPFTDDEAFRDITIATSKTFFKKKIKEALVDAIKSLNN